MWLILGLIPLLLICALLREQCVHPRILCTRLNMSVAASNFNIDIVNAERASSQANGHGLVRRKRSIHTSREGHTLCVTNLEVVLHALEIFVTVRILKMFLCVVAVLIILVPQTTCHLIRLLNMHCCYTKIWSH